MNPKSLTVAVILAFSAGTACKSGDKGAEGGAKQDPATAEVAKKPALPEGKPRGVGTKVAETAEYQILVDAPASLGPKSDGVAHVEIVPKAGWKMNNEFPAKLTVTPPAGVAMAKSEQTRADAASFAEKAAHWSFDFTANAAGEQAFKCSMKFAVCTESTCDPKKEEITWKVAVQ